MKDLIVNYAGMEETFYYSTDYRNYDATKLTRDAVIALRFSKKQEESDASYS